MKTTKFFSILGLAVLLATANAVYPAIPEERANHEGKANMIIFNVNVHLAADLALCGTYQVMLVFPDGSLVAPPQTFIPGVSGYVFTQALWPDGVRPLYIWKKKITAMLVKVTANDLACPPELFTRPDSKLVFWTTGQTIRFDLYPNQLFREEAAVSNVKD